MMQMRELDLQIALSKSWEELKEVSERKQEEKRDSELIFLMPIW